MYSHLVLVILGVPNATSCPVYCWLRTVPHAALCYTESSFGRHSHELLYLRCGSGLTGVLLIWKHVPEGDLCNCNHACKHHPNVLQAV